MTTLKVAGTLILICTPCADTLVTLVRRLDVRVNDTADSKARSTSSGSPPTSATIDRAFTLLIDLLVVGRLPPANSEEKIEACWASSPPPPPPTPTPTPPGVVGRRWEERGEPTGAAAVVDVGDSITDRSPRREKDELPRGCCSKAGPSGVSKRPRRDEGEPPPSNGVLGGKGVLAGVSVAPSLMGPPRCLSSPSFSAGNWIAAACDRIDNNIRVSTNPGTVTPPPPPPPSFSFVSPSSSPTPGNGSSRTCRIAFMTHAAFLADPRVGKGPTRSSMW